MAKQGGSQNIPIYGHPALGFPNQKIRPFYWAKENFYGAGQDSFSQPPAQDPELFKTLQDVLSPVDGVLRARWGTVSFATNGGHWGNTPRLVDFQNIETGARRIAVLSLTGVGTLAVINEDGTIAASGISMPNGRAFRAISSRSYLYLVTDASGGNGAKWADGATSITNWGITAPATALTVGTPSNVGGTAVTITIGRKYFVVYVNKNTGHYSGLNPVSASTGQFTSLSVPLTAIPTSADTQVTGRLLLATADGGDETTLYALGASLINGVWVTLNDNTTTIYTDNTDESTLFASNIFQGLDSLGNSIGVADNTPPPLTKTTLIAKHKGRIWLADGQFIRFSKSLVDLTTSTGLIAGKYEESFPAENILDISGQAETITGLLSDGSTLWVGTNQHIRRITGDDPTSFSSPDITFNNVGLLNQDTWQMVYKEGQPIGTLWVSPDNRIFLSDFNTYMEIGTPVQDWIGSRKSPGGLDLTTGALMTIGAHSFYLLSFCYSANNTGQNFPDTLLAFCLRTNRWFLWTNPGGHNQLTTTNWIGSLFGHYQLSGGMLPLIVLGNGDILKYQDNYSLDAYISATISPIIQTSYLDFGDGTLLKAINEVELILSQGSGQGPINALSTVTAQVIGTNFPVAGVTELSYTKTPVQGPIRGQVKAFFGGNALAYKYYSLSFQWQAPDFLGAYRVEVVPLSRI